MLYHIILYLISDGKFTVAYRSIYAKKNWLFRSNLTTKTPGDLEPMTLLIGLPDDQYPTLISRGINKRKNPFINQDTISGGVKWINRQRVRGLETATLEINPLLDGGYYNRTMNIEIHFPAITNSHISATHSQTIFLKNRVINWNIANQWLRKKKNSRKRSTNYPSGIWIKFSVSEDNIYSFMGEDLLALNGSLQNSDPRSYMLFTSTALGRDRSKTIINTIIYAENPENLVEIPLLIGGENNNSLDGNDQFIFYGRGVNGFNNNGESVEHQQNIYFTDNVYWLLIPDDTSLRGKRIQTQSGPSSTGLSLDYGTTYVHVEHDVINPFQGGLSWTGAGFGRGSSFTVVPILNDKKSSVPTNFKIMVRGSSTDFEFAQIPSHSISIYLNTRNILRGTIAFSGLSQKSNNFSIPGNEILEGPNLIYLDNNSPSSYSFPHFDYATINYGRKLNIDHSPFEFFAPVHSNSVTFNFTGSLEPTVWDITDVKNPKSIEIISSGLEYSMKLDLPPDTLERFILFRDDDLTPITNMEWIPGHSFSLLRNNYSGVDHLIIGPIEFESACEPLVNHRGSSRFIPLEAIYNEFSGGNADPTAIRQFLQWTQEEWTSPNPYYVLLMGDADYDYRNITGDSKIKVPTIIKGAFGNRAVDDRLAAFNGRIPDLAIGRFPARSVAEVQDFVEKIIEYETNPILGFWRQKVTLVADDGARPENGGSGGSISTGKSHTLNSEATAGWISPRVEVQKLYMLEYPEVSDASSYGVIKPDATEALFDIVAEGTAIINYIGHGSEHQWAQEKLLFQDRGDVEQLLTNMKLPIWIAGTCSWGHFDFIDTESFSEELIRQPMDGAAAIITTSRPIGVSSNANYIEKIFKAIFPDLNVTDAPIGIILQSVKDGYSSGELFLLFGDPAMPLPLPKNVVSITGISPDTLNSLDTARVFGEQSLSNGVPGVGVIKLVDADRDITRQYLFNSQMQEISYTLPGPTLFKGRYSITGNQFTAKLRIPKDISYSTTPARLNTYVQV